MVQCINILFKTIKFVVQTGFEFSSAEERGSMFHWFKCLHVTSMRKIIRL